MKRTHKEVSSDVRSDVPVGDGDHDLARLAFRLVVLWSDDVGDQAKAKESSILSEYSKEASAVYGLIRPYVARMLTLRGFDLQDVVNSRDVNAVRSVLDRVVGVQFTHPTSSAAMAKRRGPYRCRICKALKKGGCLCSPRNATQIENDHDDDLGLGLII